MSKRKTIAESLQAIEAENEPIIKTEIKENMPELLAESQTNTKQSSEDKKSFRDGKKSVTLYFEPDFIRNLKMLGLKEDKTMHEMVFEALNDYMKKKENS